MQYFSRYIYVRVLSAEPEKVISKLAVANINLHEVQFFDLLTVAFFIRLNQLPMMELLLNQSGATFTIQRKTGYLWSLFHFSKRAVLFVGITLFAVCAILLPNRIYFVDVTGNVTVPENLILCRAENCGVRFGAKAAEVRSEEVKNQLLSYIPEIQWLGIEIDGVRATIHVTERSVSNGYKVSNQVISSIIAGKDGVISKLIVDSGTPLYSVGQSVKENDVVVSGYTDCGIKMVAKNAKAEVYAYTLYEKNFTMPVLSSRIGETRQQKTCYKLRIGKKVINLCNHSGIYSGSCVKMYSEDYWILAGNFQLPISLITIETTQYHTSTSTKPDENAFVWLSDFAQNDLQANMVAGEILNESVQTEMLDEVCVLTGEYSCHEMIGQVKYEEIIERNAEDN